MIIIRACGGGVERTNVSLCHIPSSRRIFPRRRQGFKSCGILLGPHRKQCLPAILGQPGGMWNHGVLGGVGDRRTGQVLLCSFSVSVPYNNSFGPCFLKKKALYPNALCTFMKKTTGIFQSLPVTP